MQLRDDSQKVDPVFVQMEPDYKVIGSYMEVTYNSTYMCIIGYDTFRANGLENHIAVANLVNEYKLDHEQGVEPEKKTIGDCIDMALNFPQVKLYRIHSISYDERLKLLTRLITDLERIYNES